MICIEIINFQFHQSFPGSVSIRRIPKIVFIHGVGEGVLKSELDFMLGRYEEVYFQDANYQKYGQGATEVGFKQKKTN